MTRIALAPLGLFLALAACGGPSVSLTNASTDDVTKAVQKAGFKQTMAEGQWEMKIEVTEIDGDNMTPDMKAMMKASGNSTTQHCVTAEEAKKPVAELLAGMPSPKCRFTSYSASGNKVVSDMTCPGPSGTGEIKVTSSSTIQSDRIDAESESEMPMPAGKMRTKMRVTGKRTGACPATPPEPKLPAQTPLVVPEPTPKAK